MTQLEYARAVGAQLDDDLGVALLSISFASESMEPRPCLEMMVNIINDTQVHRAVRRAAAFVAVQKAHDVGDPGLAARILGEVIRGAGMSAAGNDPQAVTVRRADRAPQRDRGKNRQTDKVDD